MPTTSPGTLPFHVKRLINCRPTNRRAAAVSPSASAISIAGSASIPVDGDGHSPAIAGASVRAACTRWLLQLASARPANPLWAIPIAPPSWLYSVFPTWVPQGLRGVHAFHSGNDWTFYKPLLEGDTITPELTFTHFEDKKSQFAGRIIIVHYDDNFYNQHGEIVANAKAWSVRAERSAAQEKGK